MATAAFPENKDHIYKLLKLTIDQGTILVRKIFDEAIGNVPLHKLLAQEKKTIDRLRADNVIIKAQYDVLFPQSGNPPTTEDLDLITAVTLLRNLKACGLKPYFSWHALPQSGDTSREANICRLLRYRNELANVSWTTMIDDEEFNEKWSDIEKALFGLNDFLRSPIPNLQKCIDDLKNAVFGPKKREMKTDEKDNYEKKMLQLQQENEEQRKKILHQKDHYDPGRTKFGPETESRYYETEGKGGLFVLINDENDRKVSDFSFEHRPEREEDKSFHANLEAGTHSASKKGSTHSTDQTGSDKATQWKQVDDHGYKIKPGREEDKRFDANLDADTASAPQKGITHSTDQTGSDKATKWTQDVNAWRMCIERSDKKEAEHLIFKKILPDHEMLNKASTSFGSDLQVLKIICDEISSCIKAESNEIINVYAGYEHAGQEHVEENALVFAVITTSKSKIYVKNKFGYKLEQICIHEVNSSLENKAITLKERENPANKDEISKAEKVIIRRSQELMKKHKNITRISVSWIKSKSMDSEVCISLYVPKKGLIPIDENLFPKILDRFPVDVREGVCIPFLGPKEFHENIKIGCEISGPCKDTLYATGTLGGIFEIENQDYGLTCAHLFLPNPDLQVALEKKGNWNAPATQDSSSNNVYQPTPHYGAFGSLKQAVMSEGDENTSGVDAAYFDFHNRHPNSGLFPDDNINDTTGFDENNPMEFKFGKLSEKVNLDDSVVKFGSSTCRTNGIVRACAGTFRVFIPHIGERSFYKQYEIISSDTDTTFADCGDSGAMVFTVENRELIGIGIVEAGSPDVCFVTPICGVLSALGVNPPYKMKTFVLDTVQNKKDTTCSEHAIFNKRDNSDQGWSQDLSKQMNETSIKNDQ